MPYIKSDEKSDELLKEILRLANIQKIRTKGKNIIKSYIEVTTSYSHLELVLDLTHDPIRKRLMKLEKLGLIRRDWDHITDQGNKINNQLYLHIIIKEEKP